MDDSDTEVLTDMRLAKLTLHGFKSFADRTEFTFDEPVTAIVARTAAASRTSSMR